MPRSMYSKFRILAGGGCYISRDRGAPRGMGASQGQPEYGDGHGVSLCHGSLLAAPAMILRLAATGTENILNCPRVPAGVPSAR
jgi:hypothetical protein